MQLQIRLFQKILQLSFYGRYILYAAVRLHIPIFLQKRRKLLEAASCNIITCINICLQIVIHVLFFLIFI